MSGFNISKDDDTGKLDNGRVWVHMRSPRGHLLFVGGESDEFGKVPDEDNPGDAKPARVEVMSADSIEYLDRIFAISRDAQGDAEQAKTATELREITRRRNAALITGFENFAGPDGKELDAESEADRITFVSANESYVRQINEASMRRSDFLGYGSDNLPQSEQDSDG